MTNFAFLMDLLKISSKNFLDLGFDKSQVSRWRRGKLRLMPGRYIVQRISALFWAEDAKRSQPVLQDVLRIWYPMEPCEEEGEKQELLERFLTEKGQLDEAYVQRREKRLGSLSKAGGGDIASRGIASAKQRILDFLDLAAALPASTQIQAVYPQGRGALSADPAFQASLLEKYRMLFSQGHKMSAVIRSDGDISNFAYSYNDTLVHLLEGSLRHQYFDDFNAGAAELFLAAAGDCAALVLIEEEPGNRESTVSTIYTAPEQVKTIKAQIQDYFSRSKTREYFGFFDKPDHYLKYVHISPDSPCYLFTSLPHFGILPAEEFAQSFTLAEREVEFVSQEIRPLMLNPGFFWEYAAVRHVFCESAIESALLKKRHQSMELSKLLKRRVWMNTPHLIRQLIEVQNLLKTHKNYEVCFLSEDRFEELKVQLAVWGYGASIFWTDEEHTAASRGYMNQRVLQGFCHAAWDSIPPRTKSRGTALHKIEQWLEKARRYGYEIEQ